MRANAKQDIFGMFSGNNQKLWSFVHQLRGLRCYVRCTGCARAPQVTGVFDGLINNIPPRNLARMGAQEHL